MSLLKNIFFILILSSAFQFSMAQKPSNSISATIPSDTISSDIISQNIVSIADSVVNYGKMFLNTPYRYGATGTSAFDCSGFTSYVYRNFGFNLERSSIDQSRQFRPVNRENLKTGDLVFFSGRRRNSTVGHVGIVVSAKNGEFQFIHASVSEGVTISCSDEAYYSRRFIKANRVLPPKEVMAVEKQLREFAENQIASPLDVSVNPQFKKIRKNIPAKYHKVKQGETLSSIALKYGMSIAELKQKNSLKNSKIKPKQRLMVKEAELTTEIEVYYADNIDTVSKNIETKTDKVIAFSKPVAIPIHKVKGGETLYSISKLHNLTVDDLKKINKMDGKILHIGDELKLAYEQKNSINDTQNSKQLLADSKNKSEKVSPVDSVKNLARNTVTNNPKSKANLATVNKATNLKQDTIQVSKPAIKNIAERDIQKKITHKVSTGDTFYSIARTYGCTVTKLKEWNHKNNNVIKKGEVIIIYSPTI